VAVPGLLDVQPAGRGAAETVPMNVIAETTSRKPKIRGAALEDRILNTWHGQLGTIDKPKGAMVH
jgi:hypothetical protein